MKRKTIKEVEERPLLACAVEAAIKSKPITVSPIEDWEACQLVTGIDSAINMAIDQEVEAANEALKKLRKEKLTPPLFNPKEVEHASKKILSVLGADYKVFAKLCGSDTEMNDELAGAYYLYRNRVFMYEALDPAEYLARLGGPVDAPTLGSDGLSFQPLTTQSLADGLEAPIELAQEDYTLIDAYALKLLQDNSSVVAAKHDESWSRSRELVGEGSVQPAVLDAFLVQRHNLLYPITNGEYETIIRQEANPPMVYAAVAAHEARQNAMLDDFDDTERLGRCLDILAESKVLGEKDWRVLAKDPTSVAKLVRAWM